MYNQGMEELARTAAATSVSSSVRKAVPAGGWSGRRWLEAMITRSPERMSTATAAKGKES